MFIDPKGTFSISIAIKGIGISCSAGFQQPFWKLIGFDRLSSGKEMTGGGGGGGGGGGWRVREVEKLITGVCVTNSSAAA